MRPGPATDDLAGGLAVGARIDVIRAGRVLATGVPATDVKLEWSSGSRSVPAQVTYKAPLTWTPQDPLDALNNYGQRSLVTALMEDRTGRRWEVALGHYLHTTWSVDSAGVQVTAVDLLQLLEQNPAAWPSSPPDAATTVTELRRLTDGALPVVLDDGVPDLPVPRATQWGTSRTEAVTKLAASQGLGLRCGPDGALHAYRIRTTTHPDALYTHAGGLLLDAPRAPRSGGRRPNRWYVTGTKQGTKAGGQSQEERWTATRRSTAPPYEPEGYGWVTSHKEFSAADSQAAVEEAANTYMAQDIATAQARSLTVVPDPRIEVGDVVGAVTADGEHLAGRVTAYSLPVGDPDATMRIDIDLLEE